MLKQKTIRSRVVMKTFCSVDRNNFLLKKEKYGFQPIYIGHGATLSRPDAHVFGLENAMAMAKGKRFRKMKFLDIGSGSGVMPIYFAKLFPRTKIYGIEHIAKLAKWSLGNIAKYKRNIKNIKIIAGDGRPGLPKSGPFDFIHCGAAFKTHDIPLLKQLKKGGKMVAPVYDKINNSDRQHIWIYTKHADGKISKIRGPPHAYVDVQDNKKQVKAGEANIIIKN